MEQRRIARKHLYAGGSCWPSNFGLVISEPRLWSVFSWLSTMECPGRVSVTRQGARFLKRRAFVPARALKWQGWFWFIKVDLPWYDREHTPRSARPCISNLAAAGRFAEITWWRTGLGTPVKEFYTCLHQIFCHGCSYFSGNSWRLKPDFAVGNL